MGISQHLLGPEGPARNTETTSGPPETQPMCPRALSKCFLTSLGRGCFPGELIPAPSHTPGEELYPRSPPEPPQMQL